MPDTGDFDVNVETWKVYATSGIAGVECVSLHKIRSEFVLQIRSDSLPIRDTIECWFIVFTLRFSKGPSFFDKRLYVEVFLSVTGVTP